MPRAVVTTGGVGPVDRDCVDTGCPDATIWRGEDDEVGQLVHHPKYGWAFSYEPGEDDKEPIFRFGSHVFKKGEYVSIREHDGVERTFRVVSVENAPI